MGIESSALPPIADQIGLQSSTIPFENKAVLDLSPMQSDVGILKLSESGDGGEDGGSSGVRNGEDVDVRMDLSDDLLHLVMFLVFLENHVFICLKFVPA